jgi:hypothetical protein
MWKWALCKKIHPDSRITHNRIQHFIFDRHHTRMMWRQIKKTCLKQIFIQKKLKRFKTTVYYVKIRQQKNENHFGNIGGNSTFVLSRHCLQLHLGQKLDKRIMYVMPLSHRLGHELETVNSPQQQEWCKNRLRSMSLAA